MHGYRSCDWDGLTSREAASVKAGAKKQLLRNKLRIGHVPIRAKLARIPRESQSLRSISITGTVVNNSELSLEVLSGTRNLRLNFGSQSTVKNVSAPKSDCVSVTVGARILSPSTTGFSCPAGASAGATTITVNKLGSELPVAGKYYFLYDLNKWETHADNAEERLVGGELIKVKSVTDGGAASKRP